jgi:hypothetical protein
VILAILLLFLSLRHLLDSRSNFHHSLLYPYHRLPTNKLRRYRWGPIHLHMSQSHTQSPVVYLYWFSFAGISNWVTSLSLYLLVKLHHLQISQLDKASPIPWAFPSYYSRVLRLFYWIFNWF